MQILKRFKIIYVIFTAALILSACGFAEPDVYDLTLKLAEGQDFSLPTLADADLTELVFGVDCEDFEDFSVYWNAKGGSADMIAVFKLYDSDGTVEVSELLEAYRDARYEDFKGYAPLEAEKLENAEIHVYGRYVVLVVVSDIEKANEVLDSEFRA